MNSSLLSRTTTRRLILLGSGLGLLALAAPILDLMAAATPPTQPTPPAAPTPPATPVPAAEVQFMRDIAPILAQRCFSCHDANTKEPGGDLRLDTYEGMTKGDHPAVWPEDPESSGIILRVIEEDASSRMPRDEDPLPRAQIELIRRWIEAGAKFDGPDPKTPYAKKPAASATPTANPHPIHPPAVTAPAQAKPETKLEAKPENPPKAAEPENKDAKKP